MRTDSGGTTALLSSINLGRGSNTSLDPMTTGSPHSGSLPQSIVMAVKGPGDSLGLVSIDAAPSPPQAPGGGAAGAGGAGGEGAPSMHPPPLQRTTSAIPIWRACVRAACGSTTALATPVVLLRAKVSGLRDLVAVHPELAAAVRNIAVQQETDLKVAEALRQLRMTTMSQQQQRRLRQQQPPLSPLRL